MNSDNIQQLIDLVNGGYIRKADHPVFPLSIYNYTPKTQFEANWNPITRKTRGLVLDDTYDLIIRCPEKFFNQGEPLASPVNLNNARISEKLDGYYISIKLDSDWGLIITSRGSFQNQYVEAARKFITDDIILKMASNYTYFCELLQNFPGDESIILTQHPEPKLVCWAIMDSNFHEIIPDDTCPFPIAKELSLGEAKLYLQQKVEGIVAQDLTTFERIKTEYFIQHHRLISDCTKKRVWEILSQGDRVENLNLPDEFMPQMKEWQFQFLYEYNMEMIRLGNFQSKTDHLSDKELALSNYSPELKTLLFAVRKHGEDGVSKLIWNRLKPHGMV